MKPVRLYGAFSFSLFLHVFVIALAFLIARYSFMNKAPAPYIVSLVSESARSLTSPSGGGVVKERTPTVKEAPKKEVAEPPRVAPQQKQNKMTKVDERLVKERIASLQAKKKVEKIVALRKTIDIDASRSATPRSSPAVQEKASRPGAGGTSSGGDYYSLVVSKIRQQWIFPESIDRDLEAVVSIRIARDGRVTVDKVEKGSGNPLFDRSVLRAIAMASPLPAPPQEMELGVRFKP